MILTLIFPLQDLNKLFSGMSFLVPAQKKGLNSNRNKGLLKNEKVQYRYCIAYTLLFRFTTLLKRINIAKEFHK